MDMKSNPIIGSLEESMYVGKFDWSTCKEPLAVREYVKDTVTQIVEVCLLCSTYCLTYCILFLLRPELILNGRKSPH